MGSLNPIGAALPFIAENFGAIQQGVQLIANTARGEIDTRQAQREQELALRQLQDRQNLDRRQALQNASLERERIATAAAQNEQERRDALRRAVARQRANFGAQGVSQNGGSSQAVLLGLFDETEGELQRRTELDNLRTRAIDLDLSQKAGLNVLQRTQLKERQKLNNLDPIVDRAENVLNFGLESANIARQLKLF